MHVGRSTLLFLLAAGFFGRREPASCGAEQSPNWDALFAPLTALDGGQTLDPPQPIDRAIQQAQVSGESIAVAVDARPLVRLP